MTKDETITVTAAVPSDYQLMVKPIYGSGLRLMECLRPRVKDAFREQPLPHPRCQGDERQDHRTPRESRYHVHENALQKAVHNAVPIGGIEKHVNVHTFRHRFATHLLEANYDIRTVQELLGHKDVSTMMIYSHVLNRPRLSVKSPLDE